MHGGLRRIGFALALLLAPLPLAAARAGGEAAYYRIDQSYGAIGFTVSHLGLFSSRGAFRTFAGHIVIDEAHPEHTEVAVTIDTGSIAMAWPQAVAMLRSPAYFDVMAFPAARFVSSSVAVAADGQYDVTGLLTLRGVSRPVHLHAALVDRKLAPDHRAQVAEFVVTGSLQRSAFGMVADQGFISDRVKLEIRARVLLADPADDHRG